MQCFEHYTLCYGSSSVARGTGFDSHQDVKLFMMGMFNMKPPMACYLETWDLEIVLHFLKMLSVALSLEQLSQKLIMLVLLVTGSLPW